MLLSIGAFFFWRRYHKRMKEKYSRPQSGFANGSGAWYEQGSLVGTAAQPYQREAQPVEAYSKPLHEAPSMTNIPQELPATRYHHAFWPESG